MVPCGWLRVDVGGRATSQSHINKLRFQNTTHYCRTALKSFRTAASPINRFETAPIDSKGELLLCNSASHRLPSCLDTTFPPLFTLLTHTKFTHYLFSDQALRCLVKRSLEQPETLLQSWNFKQSVGARNRVGIGLSYRPARLHRLAEFIPWTRFMAFINV